MKLPRAPGSREARWAQLLGGPVDLSASGSAAGDDTADAVMAGEIAALKANQQRLQAEVIHLRAQLQRLALELGVDLA